MMANKPFVRVGFVGAYLPPPLVDYLRLISFQREQSNQQSIEDLLNAQKEREPEGEIISNLISHLVKNWEYHLEREEASGNQEQQKAFLKEVETRLNKKKLSGVHINVIMAGLQERIKRERR